jgi:SAM-dependent methyltransferase
VVISNHVISHTRDPRAYLAESRRVLRPGGVCYLALPNKVFPIEPFYKVPLVHWLPGAAFYRTLRALGRLEEPLTVFSPGEITRLASRCGFSCRDYTMAILREPQRFASERSLPGARRLPACVARLSPTSIFVLVA